MKSKIFLLLSILFTNISLAQNLTAKVVDINNNPIAFATVQTSDNSGVITNEEGYFTILLENAVNNELTFSCLGFTTTTVSIDEIKKNNYIIQLEEFINELSQVYLSNTTPDPYEIIRKVNENLNTNYKNKDVSYRYFRRNTAYVDFNKFEVDIKKATGFRKKQLQGVNNSLDSLTKSIINSNTKYFEDYLGDLMVSGNKDEKSKLNVLKATTLVDSRNNFSLDNVQTKSQQIILKYLDTTKTYKLKTGIIKIEDSLSLKSSDFESDNDNTYNTKYLKSSLNGFLKKAQTYDSSLLKKIVDPELYKYEFDDISSYNGELVYVLRFYPRKAKSKYAGTLYITDETFAVIKLDYEYGKGKRGDKFNLRLILGVKYIENLSSGTIIFEKKADNYYAPKYIKEEDGNYFYLSRPIKFIENSAAKNKFGLDFKIEGSAKGRTELYIIESQLFDSNIYSTFVEPEKVPFIKLSKYDPSIWKDYNAIEPLEEMKSFKAEN